MSGLLVSVRTAAEAVLARDAGVSLLDVKDPERGSLGRADSAAVAAVLDHAGACPVSAALGELIDWPDEALPDHLDRLAYLKWGLSGCREIDWRERLRRLRLLIEQASSCRVVAAAYADHARARAPAPDEVARFAIEQRHAVLLLDTWGKDGSSLLDWLSPDDAARLCATCQAAGVRVALAGSLTPRTIEVLMRHATPDWFAVRGSACGQGRRSGTLDADRVQALVELVSRSTHAG